MDHFCYLCFMSVMLSCLFIAALWLPAWKGLTFCYYVCNVSCVFVTFLCGVLGQVWHLIVSIRDICLLWENPVHFGSSCLDKYSCLPKN